MICRTDEATATADAVMWKNQTLSGWMESFRNEEECGESKSKTQNNVQDSDELNSRQEMRKRNKCGGTGRDSASKKKKKAGEQGVNGKRSVTALQQLLMSVIKLLFSSTRAKQPVTSKE